MFSSALDGMPKCSESNSGDMHGCWFIRDNCNSGAAFVATIVKVAAISLLACRVYPVCKTLHNCL